LVLSASTIGLDHFVREWFIRHEAMRATPGLVRSTFPRQALSFVIAHSSKEDDT